MKFSAPPLFSAAPRDASSDVGASAVLQGPRSRSESVVVQEGRGPPRVLLGGAEGGGKVAGGFAAVVVAAQHALGVGQGGGDARLDLVGGRRGVHLARERAHPVGQVVGAKRAVAHAQRL